MSVQATLRQQSIPTYPVGTPDKNPMFFDKRVYQGSSGKIYPLPFIDKVYDEPRDVNYQLVVLENDYVYLELLPEIGGRIFKAQDKANAGYDFFYRQEVIKPALVGLAGPWISGGAEFNWPQHHRPGTFLPTDVYIEEEDDGARTVWMSELDPLTRLKGMHGIRLRPGSAVVELRARLHNRTPRAHTFLWWANIAARVHDQYQSFFPPDVHYVADHAVRAMSSFPKAENHYYGIDYAARPGANDLSWYKNIPVPTSYMVCETGYGFFGGYDFAQQGGFIHVANRHISPGKKQWTWGNHPFGWAWDRELTDTGGPYVELMAGVYTDNQPDFSYLMPTEEKHFSQCWWPFQQIGPVQEASEEAAIRLVALEDGKFEAAVVASRRFEQAQIELKRGDTTVHQATVTLAPDQPWQRSDFALEGHPLSDFELRVMDAHGKLLLRYRPAAQTQTVRHREQATEPPAPTETDTLDELILIAEHLEQYRHPTRAPEPYWQEALRRDPGEARAHLGLGRKLLRQGAFEKARAALQRAVDRLTARHPNPETGEAHYYLGLALRYLGRCEEAYAALYKSTWNYAWRAPAYFELACLDLRRSDERKAREHAEEALETNRRHHQALVLLAALDRRNQREPQALARLQRVLQRDPLDPWALAEEALLRDDFDTLHQRTRNDAQTVLDIAFAYANAGLDEDAVQVLLWHHQTPPVPVAVPPLLSASPSTHYLLAFLLDRMGLTDAAAAELTEAHSLSRDYFFPSRLDEQLVLNWALQQEPSDATAAFGLGNYLYDKAQQEGAIAHWERCVADEPDFATAWRNLGIAYWNVRRDGDQAQHAYSRALSADPADARLVFEADQLEKKLQAPTADRLAFMLRHEERVRERDDACVEFATLLNDDRQPEAALDLLLSRRFHPWEGGEGKVLLQYKRAHLLLAQAALKAPQPKRALDHCERALEPPQTLGETYHPLQNQADIHFWRGKALRALGREDEAVAAFERCVQTTGDFQQMAVVPFSELSIYAGRALQELGRTDDAQALFQRILAYVAETRPQPAKIDYFATSLPNLLVFDEDPQETRDAQLDRLEKLARKALG
ncbi:MAG: hypothetical protein E1N59_2694 [Puniceicoccaceae bacterium 5H]|nr:MAG: hypothetical protein E1N59_2694 [Puniceicoccaceae bacterium 5H]